METPTHGPNFLRPPPDLIDGKAKYEVETIKSHHNFRHCHQLQYLIKWKGYLESNNTWELASLVHAPLLVNEYQSDTA
jgi:hypothetical protein